MPRVLALSRSGLPELATWEVHLAPKNRRWHLGDLLATFFRAFGVFCEFLEPIWRP